MEAVGRLIAGYLVDDHVLRESFADFAPILSSRTSSAPAHRGAFLARLRGGASGSGRRAKVADAERFAATLPEREQYLSPVHNLGNRIVDTLDAWLDEVDQEFAPDARRKRKRT